MGGYHYVYVLQSGKDGNFYVGYTRDVKRRIEEHNSGEVPSTRRRVPLEII
jgi:putative endonuclease